LYNIYVEFSKTAWREQCRCISPSEHLETVSRVPTVLGTRSRVFLPWSVKSSRCLSRTPTSVRSTTWRANDAFRSESCHPSTSCHQPSSSRGWSRLTHRFARSTHQVRRSGGAVDTTFFEYLEEGCFFIQNTRQLRGYVYIMLP